MANDRLRTAILAARYSVEDVAARLGVDPKTVDRWIGNERRKPHRSTRRDLCKLLKVTEADLWPDLGDTDSRTSSDAELVHLYPSRSAVPGAAWERLIQDTCEQMDVLVFSGAFLVEQYDLIPIVKEKESQGVRYRFLIGDHTSHAVIQRGKDEGTEGGLEGRAQLMRRYLSEVEALEGVELRTHSTILYNSLYRFDDHLLVNGHAYGALAGQNPVLHLKRLPDGYMWQHYMRSFERVWELATPEEEQEK